MENRIITERERFEPREKLRMSLAHQLKAMRAEQELMRNDRKQSRLEERRLTSRFKCMQQQIMRERLRVCGFRIAMELVAEEMHEILNNFGGEEFSGTLSLVGEASDRANVDEESQLASGNVHQHHSERNFKMETRLKKELISFYHRQCRDEGASAAIAEPKGYVQSAKPLEDPIIVKVMNLPYVVEELMKGQSNHDSALEVSTAKRKGVEGKKTPSATSVKDLIKSVGSASLAELLAGSRMSMYAASSSASISLDGDVNQQQSSEKLSQDDAADMDSTNTDNAGSTDIHGSFASIHAFNNNNNDAQDNLIRTILQSKLNIKRNPFDESTHHAAVVDQLMQSSRSQADRDTNFARKEMRRLLAEQQLLRTDLNAARAEVMLQKEKMRKIPDSERRNTLPPIVRSRL